MPALVSPDGRWFWDGSRWRSRMVEGPLDLFWFTSTPEWENRILLTGLIALIPIVGSINTLGWTLVATDMIRQRWKELPPAGLQYVERGVAPFVLGLVYGLVAFLVLAALFVGGLVLLFSNGSVPALGVVLIVLSVVFLVAWWLISLLIFAAILIGSDRLGLGHAINPAVLVRLVRQNMNASLHAALIYGLGALALGAVGLMIGFIIPFGGLILSIGLPAVYAMTVPPLATFEARPVAAHAPSAILPASPVTEPQDLDRGR